MRNPLRNPWIAGVCVLAASIALSFPVRAQTPQALPVPGYEPAKQLPGAKELPDPNVTYKVVFDVSKAAAKVDEVNPTLLVLAEYLNTLAANGVPADHRQIVAVFHQEAVGIVQNNEAFKARNAGHDNPNIALIQSLKKAGVDLRVCGQGVLGNKIDPKTIQPEIELDLWALTTLVNLQLRGYVHVGS